MSENSMGVKCLALNVRATNVWKSKWALNVRRQMSENSHWRQMSLGVKCHMPISRQMSLASIVTTSNRHQRSGLKSLGDKRPRRQTAWILQNISDHSIPILCPTSILNITWLNVPKVDQLPNLTYISKFYWNLCGFVKVWNHHTASARAVKCGCIFCNER